jgi:hypothetical protein
MPGAPFLNRRAKQPSGRSRSRQHPGGPPARRPQATLHLVKAGAFTDVVLIAGAASALPQPAKQIPTALGESALPALAARYTGASHMFCGSSPRTMKSYSWRIFVSLEPGVLRIRCPHRFCPSTQLTLLGLPTMGCSTMGGDAVAALSLRRPWTSLREAQIIISPGT